VGQIGLDLVVNTNSFNRQMAGIQNLAKKAGAALAGAFAVKKLVDFSSQCIKLGSDLQEVQNVVDVTFPQMNKQIDNFAKNAAASFGLSETMAKKFTGTFGAMAKAFGFSEQAAYEMSTTLTGLAGDVASFYNLSQDEAYTKLKSVFTGETESLKDLGVVMTQAALDQYALANGYGKTTQAMSEAEKVALRYQFVTDQLSLASGDFIRTSDGWANQVRVLKLQFDSLKATIGQGLINVLTPVIKVINTIIGKLMSLANAFKSFTELITGKKGGGGTSAATAGLDAVTGAADQAGKSASGAGSAAKKAAKDMKGITTGIDELNIIQPPDEEGSGGGGTGGASGGYEVDEFDMGEIDTSPVDELDKKYQKLLDRAKELSNLFKGGFTIAFGGTEVLDSIQESLTGIKTSVLDIFNDPAVQESANMLANRIAMDLGKIAGSMASIGASIGDNLLGGIDLYLQGSGQQIKNYLVSMFDIGSEVSNICGRVSQAWTTVFETFRSDDAKKITSDIIGIFSSAFMGVTELGAKFGTDILNVLTKPFTENAGLIKETLENTFSAVAPVVEELKLIVDEFFTKARETYDTYWAPMMESLSTGISEIVTVMLESYNEYIAPVIEKMSDRFAEFREKYLSPLIDKFMEFRGKVAEVITAVWQNFLQPFITWFIKNIAPYIARDLETVINIFFFLLESVSKVCGDIMEDLNGVLDFVSKVFTADWGSIWENIKSTTESIFDGIWEAIKNTINSILSGVETMANGVVRGINKMIDALNNLSFEIPDWVPELGGESFGLNIPNIPEVSIPRLAQGGFVRANTPQLAMIGDNRHYGEIVAPEDKMQEMVDRAVSMVSRNGTGMSEQYLLVMIELLKKIIDLIENMDLTVSIDVREIKKKLVDLEKRSGHTLRTT
ncbi:MAG: hypothetical protein ACLT46_13075, partial [Hungatella sp.]